MGRIEFDSIEQQEKYREKPYLVGLFDIIKKYPQVDGLLEQLENFDQITFQHSLRAEAYGWNLASELGFQEEDRRTFCLAALMHDIGKLKLDKDLINKHPFEKGDIEKMKPHVVTSFRKLYDICPDAAEIVLRHHSFQKDPYPSDEEISQLSKVDDPVKLAKIEKMAELLSMVDVFETRSGERVDKAPEPLKKFLPDIREQFSSVDDEKAIRILMKTLSKEKIIKRLHPKIANSSNLYLKHPIRPLPEISELMQETEEIWERFGHGSIEKRREILLGSMSETERKYLENVEGETKELVDGIKELPEVLRLKFLMQLGGTMDRSMQTRFSHSGLDAELAKFAGVKLGLPVEDVKISIVSAWLHDIGHAALCHVSDPLLEKYDRGNHEKRTIRMIMDSEGKIGVFLTRHKIDSKRVADTVGEKGYLGTLQSFFDTLSYLILDSRAIERPIYEDQGKELISDLRGIDRERNLLIVKTLSLWQDLLEKRAAMMKEVYLHPNNRRQRAAMRVFMEIAVKNRLISLEKIEKSGDGELEMNFQNLVRADKAAATIAGKNEFFSFLKGYKDIWSLAYFPAEKDKWEVKMFESKGEMSQYLSEIFPKDQLIQALEQTVIVSPFDYTKKEITVLPEGSKNPVTLRAKGVELRKEDKQYTVYIPKKFMRGYYDEKK